MNDSTAIERALEQLVAERDFHKNEAAVRDAAIRALLQVTRGDRQPDVVVTMPPRVVEPRRASRSRKAARGSTKRQSNKPVLLEVLRENAGRPMHVSEMLMVMEQKGHKIQSKYPANNIATALGRMVKEGILIAHGGATYTFVGDGNLLGPPSRMTADQALNGSAMSREPVEALHGA
jgi:hypothetical protein